MFTDHVQGKGNFFRFNDAEEILILYKLPKQLFIQLTMFTMSLPGINNAWTVYVLK